MYKNRSHQNLFYQDMYLRMYSNELVTSEARTLSGALSMKIYLSVKAISYCHEVSSSWSQCSNEKGETRCRKSDRHTGRRCRQPTTDTSTCHRRKSICFCRWAAASRPATPSRDPPHLVARHRPSLAALCSRSSAASVASTPPQSGLECRRSHYTPLPATQQSHFNQVTDLREDSSRTFKDVQFRLTFNGQGILDSGDVLQAVQRNPHLHILHGDIQQALKLLQRFG